MRLEHTIAIDCSVAAVWAFCVVDHVRNHPRWDSDIELSLRTDGALGLGSVITRRNTRYERPVEGTMEITEWDPPRRMGARIQEGSMVGGGWISLASDGPNRTLLTRAAEFPGTDPAIRERVLARMDETGRILKALVESET
jgi:hypothetical protein